VTEQMIRTVTPLLEVGDTIVDGGNTNFNDDMRCAAMLKEHGLNYIDQGTSGGVWGPENGFCIMVGGEDELVKRLEPAFLSLAPTDGYVHCGPVGSGHFVKMVHNGIEYGMMQAYAEGFAIMRAKKEFNLRHHEQVWPEMLQALRDAGWHNYSLFVRDDGLLFGYFETPESLQAAQARMAEQVVNTRWQEFMAPFFESPNNARPDELFVELTEIFHLD